MKTHPTFSRAVWEGLEPGNVVETQPFMEGLSKEPLVWTVIRKSVKGAVTFDLTYFGVYVATAVCVFQKKAQQPTWVVDTHKRAA